MHTYDWHPKAVFSFIPFILYKTLHFQKIGENWRKTEEKKKKKKKKKKRQQPAPRPSWVSVMMASALEYFESGARENVREDGRENCMFRTVVVERGVVESAAGSAQVQVGDTKVLCGLSLEMCNPVENKPKGGLVEVSVDVSMARSIAGSSWKEYDKDGEELANQIKVSSDQFTCFTRMTPDLT